jgi:hypothetical protein
MGKAERVGYQHTRKRSRVDLGNLKQRLVEHLASGNLSSADEVRRELEIASIQRRARDLAVTPSDPAVSSASWIGDDGIEETITLHATPEARKYFAANSVDEDS